MSVYKYVFFDLDGTISDSAPGIINAVTYALDEMGIKYGNSDELKQFVGPPLVESFTSYCGFDKKQADKAIELFRVYYSDRGIMENSMYPGIRELLEALRAGGRHIVLATSKPETFAREIIARYGIGDCFEYIAGSTMDETRVKKHQVIAYAMETLGLNDPSKIVMVGDRRHDAEGARVYGMDCIGVLYGYGSRDELLSAGVKYLVDTPAGIARLILD